MGTQPPFFKVLRAQRNLRSLLAQKSVFICQTCIKAFERHSIGAQILTNIIVGLHIRIRAYNIPQNPILLISAPI